MLTWPAMLAVKVLQVNAVKETDAATAGMG